MFANLGTRNSYTKYQLKIKIGSNLPLLIWIVCKCIDKVLFVLIFYVFSVSSEWARTFSYVVVRRQTIQYIFWCHVFRFQRSDYFNIKVISTGRYSIKKCYIVPNHHENTQKRLCHSK